MAAAIYAYAFLFPDDGSAADRPDPLDPRFRQASDLYNFTLTAAVTPSGGGAAVFRSGQYPLPFGTIEIVIDENSFSSGGRALTFFQRTGRPLGRASFFRSPSSH